MIRAHATTFDASDTLALARFWSEALGEPLDEGASDEFASIGMSAEAPPAGRWMFIKVPESKTAKNRVHVDFGTDADDLESEVARLVALGAARLADQEIPEVRWVTLADPEGNEFDVLVEAGA